MNTNERVDTNQPTNGYNNVQSVVDVINKRGGSIAKEAGMFRLMMHVIQGDSVDGHFWMSGYRLGGLDVKRKPRETIRVRLNTVEERVKEEEGFSNSKPSAVIQNSVKALYITGANRRKTLQEHIQSSTRLISFERVVYLYTKEGIKYYRAHWSTAMTSDPQGQFIQGMGHIRIIQGNEQLGRKSTCQAEIIESMLVAAGREDAEKNNIMIAKALNSIDQTSKLETAERTGKLMVEMVVNGERNTRTIDIYSEKEEVEVTSPVGEKIKVRKAISYADTIQAYLTGNDYHTMMYKADPNNVYKRDRAFDADINRHVLGYLLGIAAKTIPIIREDIADSAIKPFVNSLYKKDIVLNLFAVRIYQYGKRYRTLTLNKTLTQKLHQNYVVAIDENDNIIPYHEASQLPATPAYSPTAIVVQRYDDGTAYVVFDGAVDMKKDNFVISSDIPPDSVEKFKDFFSIPPVA